MAGAEMLFGFRERALLLDRLCSGWRRLGRGSRRIGGCARRAAGFALVDGRSRRRFLACDLVAVAPYRLALAVSPVIALTPSTLSTVRRRFLVRFFMRTE
jgi:hypothetical protein